MEGVNSLVIEFNAGKLAQLSDALDSAQKATDHIIKHQGWQGNKATNTKDYLTYAHGATINTFMAALKSAYDHLLLYRDAAERIESGHYAIIPENELLSLSARLLTSAALFASMGEYAESIVKSVESIGHVSFSGFDSLTDNTKKLSEKLDTLDQDIVSNESTYQQLFESDKAAFAAIRNMIASQRGMDPSKFSTQALANNKTYQELGQQFQALCEEIGKNEDKVKAAQESYQKTYDALVKEYEERKKAAEKKKFWLGVLTAVGSAVIIAATGGAGAVVIGGIAGAINAAGSSYLDQGVGSVGCVGRVDFKQVLNAGAFGFATGALTSWAGGAISAKGTSVIAKYGMTGVKKVVTKAAFSGATSAVNGAISRAGDACYDSIRSGESVLGTLDNMWNAATDFKQVAGDFAGGFTGSVISQGIESVSDKLGEKVFAEDKGRREYTAKQVLPGQVPSGTEQVYQVLSETAKETGKGIGKRFTSTLVKTGDIEAAWNSATDLQQISSDILTTIGSETATRTIENEKMKASFQAEVEEELDDIQNKVNAKLTQENEQNAELCDELGINRTKTGVPDFKGRPECLGETEYEAQYVDPKEVEGRVKQGEVNTDNPRQTAKDTASNWEKKAAYDNMVKNGQLDSDRYEWKNGSVTDKETGTKYTMHHVEYDVKTGKGRMQLVETKAHKGIHHSGSASQRDSAYNDYNVDEVMEKYNTGYGDSVRSKYNNSVKKGADSGQKITTTKQEYGAEPEPERMPNLEYNPDFKFVPVGG